MATRDSPQSVGGLPIERIVAAVEKDIETTRSAREEVRQPQRSVDAQPPPGAVTQPSAMVYADVRPYRRRSGCLTSAWMWFGLLLVGGGLLVGYTSAPEELPVIGAVEESSAGVVLAVAGLVVWLALTFYFLPTLMAFGRHSTNKGAVFVINLLFGWSLIGWVVALVMAASAPREPPLSPAIGALDRTGR